MPSSELMNWILADLTMFVCSVAVYVAVRKAALRGLPSQFNNLAMFALPLPIFLFAGLISGASFAISRTQAGEIVAAAIVLSYAGNALSMKSIAIAPNPGYSLMLSKSYVVFTTIWAVIFFDSLVTWRSSAAIVVIVAASALIMLERRGVRTTSGHRWLPSAVGAFFCWGFLSLVAKHLESHNVTTIAFLTYTFAIVNVCIVLEMTRRKVSLRVVKSNLSSFVTIGVAAAGFNFFNFYAINAAPNVGYVNATNAASIGAVTVAAAFLFKDELTKQKIAGVIGVIAGLLLLLV